MSPLVGLATSARYSTRNHPAAGHDADEQVEQVGIGGGWPRGEACDDGGSEDQVIDANAQGLPLEAVECSSIYFIQVS